MPLSDEQIAEAKKWDLLSYLQRYEPDELIKSGPHEYRTKSHHSLVISNGLWNWINGRVGGKNALTYLIKVRGMDFRDAVELLGGKGTPPPVQVHPEPPKPFVLPQPAQTNEVAIQYLQHRGIDPGILRVCIKSKRLYESKKYHNCVFVGYDPTGKSRFACVRSTIGSYKHDVGGSSKRYAFCLPSQYTSDRVAVCEAPIDALSVATLRKYCGRNWRDCSYLSLGGTAPLALIQFLHDHAEIQKVYACLDNDAAGMDGAKRLREAAVEELKGRNIEFAFCPPSKTYGKDYNEMLVAKVRQFKKNVLRRQPVYEPVR